MSDEKKPVTILDSMIEHEKALNEAANSVKEKYADADFAFVDACERRGIPAVTAFAGLIAFHRVALRRLEVKLGELVVKAEAKAAAEEGAK